MLPVAVIDEDKLSRRNLHSLLAAASINAEEFSAPLGYLESGLFTNPHVSVISLNFDRFDGLDIVEATTKRSAALCVFSVINKPDTTKTVAAMKLGCTDVLEKPIRAVSIIEAAKGQLRSKSLAKRHVIDAEKSLTAREQEILRCILANKTNRQIAQELEVKIRTIETHRARLYAKLNVSSHTELIQKWRA